MNFPDMFGFLDSKIFWIVFFSILIGGIYKISELIYWLYCHISIN